MSRTLRIEYPGAVYHVQSEGNRGDAIYLDDEDRETFLPWSGICPQTDDPAFGGVR